MIELPAGEFIFQGVSGVMFKGGKIAETEVTNGQFRELFRLKPEELSRMVENPQELLEKSLSAVDPNHRDEAENCPLVYVNQMEAEGIARLLGKRLPTELEQERAMTFTDGRAYPFGNEFDRNKVTFDGKGTRSVYAHKDGASLEGILDLAGNVWEWSGSWYGEIDLSDPKSLKLPESGQYKALRGGSWCFNDPDNLRGDSRFYNLQEYRVSGHGFRVAED